MINCYKKLTMVNISNKGRFRLKRSLPYCVVTPIRFDNFLKVVKSLVCSLYHD